MDFKNGEVDLECLSVRYREAARGLEPALWLVGVNCLSLGRFMFTLVRGEMLMFLVLPMFESAEWR